MKKGYLVFLQIEFIKIMWTIIMRQFRSIWKNTSAIAEEFTALPALAIVMIGFCLFILLLTGSYLSYEQHSADAELIKHTEYLCGQLFSPLCPFISSTGSVDIGLLNQNTSTDYIRLLQKSIRSNSLNFTIKITYKNNSQYIPESPPNSVWHRIGYSNQKVIAVNELNASPGLITVIVWKR